MNKGKAICETLKQLRLDIAKANNIDYHPEECTHKGPCSGTCPKCEQELAHLTVEIEKRQVAGIEPNFEGCSSLEDVAEMMAEFEPDEVILEGMPPAPDPKPRKKRNKK